MASDPPSSILPEGWSWGDVGHGALDVIGLVPVVGEAADLANAAWHAATGNYLEAGLSMISMIPIVGDAIGKGGKALKKIGGPALDLLKKMDFGKYLQRWANHPKLGKYIKPIKDALDKWRKDMFGIDPPGAGSVPTPPPTAAATPKGIVKCPVATKALGEAATMIGKTPVPIRILNKLNPAQRAAFEKAIAAVEAEPLKAAKDQAVFYSGQVGGTPAWKLVDQITAAGKGQSVNSLSKNLLNRPEFRNVLPDDAMGFIDNLASRKLAENASGAIKFLGDLDKINPNSVFRKIELPALLNNPNIDGASKAALRRTRQFLDAKYGK